MAAPSVILAFRRDLFGDRLLNLLHAWRFARYVGRRLFVLWPAKTAFAAWDDCSANIAEYTATLKTQPEG